MRVAGNGVRKKRTEETPTGTAPSTNYPADDMLLALAPAGPPLVVGQRGLAELLDDLAVATDDLSS